MALGAAPDPSAPASATDIKEAGASLFAAIDARDAEILRQTLDFMRDGAGGEPRAVLRDAAGCRSFWTDQTPLLAAVDAGRLDLARLILDACPDAAGAWDAWGAGAALLAVRGGTRDTEPDVVAFLDECARLYPEAMAGGPAVGPPGAVPVLDGAPGGKRRASAAPSVRSQHLAGLAMAASKAGLVAVLHRIIEIHYQWHPDEAAAAAGPGGRGPVCGSSLRSTKGATPLHTACRNGRAGMAVWLAWCHGVCPRVLDSSGRDAASMLGSARLTWDLGAVSRPAAGPAGMDMLSELVRRGREDAEGAGGGKAALRRLLQRCHNRCSRWCLRSRLVLWRAAPWWT